MFKIKNRLTNQQVLYASALLVTLFLNLFPMVALDSIWYHGYLFADRRLQWLAIVIVSLLPTALVALVSLGQPSKWRTFLLVTLIPINLIALYLLSNCLYVLSRGIDVGVLAGADIKPTQIGEVAANLVFIGNENLSCRLRLERYVLGNILREYKTLIDVDPVDEAHFEIIDRGQKIRFTAAAFPGHSKVERVFDTDWNSKNNLRCEKVNAR